MPDKQPGDAEFAFGTPERVTEPEAKRTAAETVDERPVAGDVAARAESAAAAAPKAAGEEAVASKEAGGGAMDGETAEEGKHAFTVDVVRSAWRHVEGPFCCCSAAYPCLTAQCRRRARLFAERWPSIPWSHGFTTPYFSTVIGTSETTCSALFGWKSKPGVFHSSLDHRHVWWSRGAWCCSVNPPWRVEAAWS